MARPLFPKPAFDGKRQQRYYLPVRWNGQDVLDALGFFHRCYKKPPRFLRRFAGRQLETLHLLRVPLATLGLLFASPWIALELWPELLENLVLDLGFLDVSLSTLVAVLTAATAVAVINAVLVNGHERFPPLVFGRIYGAPLELLVVVGPGPLVWAIASHSSDGAWMGALGAALGVLVALLPLAAVRIELIEHGRRLQQTTGLKSWRVRPLVYPHELPFLDNRPNGLFTRLAWGTYRLIRRTIEFLEWTARVFKLVPLLSRLKRLLPGPGYLHVPPGSAERPLYSAHRHLLLLLSALLFIWISLTLGKGVELGWGVSFSLFPAPTLAYITLNLWLACLVMASITFWVDRYRIPLLTILGVWAVSGTYLFGNDHYYATQRTALVREAALEPAAILARASNRRVILVAAAGGGIQAAGWTARVLTGIEQALPGQFGRSVALLSGVSGGSVGVYYFVDAYGDDGALSPERLSQAHLNATRSSLEDVAWGLVAPDLLRVILPLKLDGRRRLVDRGWALERSLALRSSNDTARLSDWEQDVRRGVKPAVILNATLVESGRPLRFATTRMGRSRATQSWYDAVDFRSLRLVSQEAQPEAADIRVATAARLSSTFPFVTPVATSVESGPTELSQHVADGGYYDNFGMMSMMTWLHEGLERSDDPPTDVLVLQIRSFPETGLPPREQERSWLFQTYAPLTALMSVRTAAQRLRNEQEFNYLRCYWKELGVTIETLVVDYERDPAYDDPEPPLSWSLRTGQKDAIERAWAREVEQTQQTVRRFLRSGAAEDCPCAETASGG